jgi:thiol-disulfide isomerase/thioredoxin
MNRIFVLLLLLTSSSTVLATTPEQQYAELEKSFQAEFNACKAAFNEAKTDEEKKKAKERLPKYDVYTQKFWELAQAHPKTPAARDSLIWIVNNTWGMKGSPALDLLFEHHISDEKLFSILVPIFFHLDSKREKVFHTILEKNSHRSVQGYARYLLAKSLRDSKQTKAKQLFQEVIHDYGDVSDGQDLLKNLAQSELFEMEHIVVGKAAPEIIGQDVDGKIFKLSDHRGKVVLLVFCGDWCGPCRGMYPHERELVQRYKDKPFVLLGVNCGDSKERLQATIKREKMNWRWWWDGGTLGQGAIQKLWNINAFPSFHIIDSKGILRFKDLHDSKQIDEALKTLLGP